MRIARTTMIGEMGGIDQLETMTGVLVIAVDVSKNARFMKEEHFKDFAISRDLLTCQ